MYTDLKRREKLQLARKFYYHLNYQYSSGGQGLPMAKWISILEKENEDMNISCCLMWYNSYQSIFQLLLKKYNVFRIVDKSQTPFLYDIANNEEHLLNEFIEK